MCKKYMIRSVGNRKNNKISDPLGGGKIIDNSKKQKYTMGYNFHSPE